MIIAPSAFTTYTAAKPSSPPMTCTNYILSLQDLSSRHKCSVGIALVLNKPSTSYKPEPRGIGCNCFPYAKMNPSQSAVICGQRSTRDSAPRKPNGKHVFKRPKFPASCDGYKASCQHIGDLSISRENYEAVRQIDNHPTNEADADDESNVEDTFVS